jgi:hypothetical protein
MGIQQKRGARRVPFESPMQFKVMGNTTHTPDHTATDGKILDISNDGMKIREEGRPLQAGFILLLRVPITETQTTVPTMAQVKWVRPAEPECYEAGLMFLV